MGGHTPFHRSLMVLWLIVQLGMPPRGFVVEAQVSVQASVTLTNRMDSGEVVSMDCMLNDTSINPKGFLTGVSSVSGSGTSNAVTISEQLTPEDAIFCDFKLGFVARDLVQVTVQCSAAGVCSPMAVDFTNQGAYFNLSSWNQPSGLPDVPWSTLLPSGSRSR
ncbi:unnamed protein product [Calypogeia fissa]